MIFKVKKGDALKQKTPCLVIAVQEGKLNTPLLKEIDRHLEGILGRIAKSGEFTGKFKETALLHPAKRLPAERILLLGLGKERTNGAERLRQAAGTAASFLQGRRITSFTLDLASLAGRGTDHRSRAMAATEGVFLATYRFDAYRSSSENGNDQQPPPLSEVVLLAEKQSEMASAEEGVALAQAVNQGVALARDLVNEPGNTKSPAYLAEQASSMAEGTGLKCTILDRSALERLKMGALLGVAQGSVREPRLITLEYSGGTEGAKPVVLIGKGVVFDAGGISLKPSEKMDEMKMDMAGGAAVLGTMLAVARLKLPVNVVGIVPAVENLPSGSAIRPGDILTSLSGRTIEVLNTDAEGRLILADALTYAKRFDPRLVIDVATLTGACIIALGHHASAVLGNHDGLVKQLIKAGDACGERLWQLPLWEDYSAQIRSDVADVKNVGGRPAGTITAAAFLQKFAAEYTWAHIDIAGTAWEEKGRPYIPKGGTGVGVRLLIEYLRGIRNH